ncbi:hypothetical protein T310_3350 [Rasamsonia emersonii CBS 393.64]|uniref:AB hydrolase-1 domain-containing protein n=1 Tax=Rasamsonia emersonii (strain ATCC 16479 / CBS 393.64 / IMI 116815) TaxID=1408163 RepID=A0A0F4YY99_RASE3|nr:hypothetical protein T310_3350 [Rasamsonia emersonii CBS 393.64]KKA22613.1 hypothetical protein T310_3350 [Rasamsonia emersonii CBS 393.64]
MAIFDDLSWSPAALYAHKINPTLWQDLNDVENFGFLSMRVFDLFFVDLADDRYAGTQVQPFHLVTPDNETLYGWHILPLHLCREHEELLNEHMSYGPAEDYTKTVAYKLLAEDPNARVVVNCKCRPPSSSHPKQPDLTDLSVHGNAAHLGSALRPEMYRMYLGISTPSNPVHIFAIDYRGFGLSTGSPTEEGVITDGLTLLNFLTSSPLNVPPSRIAIVGLSLGTAVTSAAAERFAFGAPESAIIQPAIKDPEPFAGIILLASFSNIPNLIESYSLKGLTPPMLSPLIGYPRAQKYFLDRIYDRWDTAARVARLTGVGPTAKDESDAVYANKALDLTIVHARDDVEIPWWEGARVWKAAIGETEKGEPSEGKFVYERIAENGLTEIRVWEKEVQPEKGARAVKKVRWEKVGYGGHNHVGAYSVAALAVLRAFEE